MLLGLFEDGVAFDGVDGVRVGDIWIANAKLELFLIFIWRFSFLNHQKIAYLSQEWSSANLFPPELFK